MSDLSRRVANILKDEFSTVGKVNDTIESRARTLIENARTCNPRMSTKNFVNNSAGRLKRRYKNAMQQVIKNGFRPYKHSRMAVFVKKERFYKEGKAPRLIMGRDPRFTLFYQKFIQTFDKAFFRLVQCSSLDDFKRRGEKFADLVGEWFIENDFSACESSIREFFLDLQAECIMNSFRLAGIEIEDFEKAWFIKVIKDGQWGEQLSFAFQECTGSGDADTGSLNGFVNYVSTRYFLIKNVEPDCKIDQTCKNCKTDKFLLTGDDDVMKWPRGVESFENTYAYFGLDAKLELRRTPEEVEFCSGHFVEYFPGKYMYVQKLVKLVEGLTTCINDEIIDRGWVGHYYKSLGMMYKVLYKDIPVYEDIADFLLATNFDGGVNVELVDSYNLLTGFREHDSQNKIVVHKNHALVSVSLINGISIPDLMRMSDWFRTNKLVVEPSLNHRCNKRSKPIDDVTDEEEKLFDASFINAWHQLVFDKRTRQIKSRLDRIRRGVVSSG